MAINDTTKPMICQLANKAKPFNKDSLKSSLPEMSSSVQAYSMEKDARVSAMKSRYAGLICKAQQILNAKDKPTDEEKPAKKLIEKTTSTRSEVEYVSRESSVGILSKIKKGQEEVGYEGDHRNDQLVFNRSQEVLERRRETDHNFFLEVKKRQEIDLQREAQDETAYVKKKRRQEIERQREAARISINKITKTVDFDNLSVMVEFERLLCC